MDHEVQMAEARHEQTPLSKIREGDTSVPYPRSGKRQGTPSLWLDRVPPPHDATGRAGKRSVYLIVSFPGNGPATWVTKCKWGVGAVMVPSFARATNLFFQSNYDFKK